LCPPIALAYLAASLREQGYPVSIVDPVGEAPFEMNPIPGRPLVSYGWSLDKIVAAIPRDTRYIGLSCMFSHEWPVSKLLAQKIRERFPDVVIIAGGEHITAAPEFSLRDCRALDYAVLGEGEETLVELLNVLEHGGDASSVAGLVCLRDSETIRTMPRQRVRVMDSIPWPAWDLVPIESYLSNHLSWGISEGRTMPIVATRGCPYNCTFCSSPQMWGRRWYPRSPKDVADEIETYIRSYGADNFDFYDLTAVLNKEWIVEFCHELNNRKLDITWQMPGGTRSEAIDDEIGSLLARSGHRNLVYAPESGSERMLKLIKKKTRIPRMLGSMRAAIRSGISVKLNMVVGFPEETPRDIIQTYLFLAKTAWIGVDDVNIYAFIPYPGSELFHDLQRAGKIKALDEEYFFGLVAMGDVKNIVSYAEKIGRKALLAYKLFGIFLFYSISYLSHPRRIFQTLWHLYRGSHQTRIEKALSAVIDRIRRHRRFAASEIAESTAVGVRVPAKDSTKS
jgi:radical SAM superfamily enzyme YgiQ (UPF0313 family)